MQVVGKGGNLDCRDSIRDDEFLELHVHSVMRYSLLLVIFLCISRVVGFHTRVVQHSWAIRKVVLGCTDKGNIIGIRHEHDGVSMVSSLK